VVQLGHRRAALVAGSFDEWSVGVFGGTPPRYGGGPAAPLTAALRSLAVGQACSLAGSNPGRTSLIFGLLVQRDDTWLATRKSGFDSPAVH
jgi:hypothetical protein